MLIFGCKFIRIFEIIGSSINISIIIGIGVAVRVAVAVICFGSIIMVSDIVAAIFGFTTVLNAIALSWLDDVGDWDSAFLNQLDGVADSNSMNIDTATFNVVLKAIIMLGRDEGAVRRAEGVLTRITKTNI